MVVDLGTPYAGEVEGDRATAALLAKGHAIGAGGGHETAHLAPVVEHHNDLLQGLRPLRRKMIDDVPSEPPRIIHAGQSIPPSPG